MRGHVILEGADGSGKTTLARELCERYDMAYWHEGPPPVGADALMHYAGLLIRAKRPTVFDRFHLGEVIYGPLLRGGSQLGQREVQLLNQLITGMGVCVVKCHAPWDACLHNTRNKQELIKDEGLLKVAHDLWGMLFCNVDLLRNDQFYDYTRDKSLDLIDYPTSVDDVISFLQETCDAA